MQNFRVVWEIDIEEESARDAAEEALKIQRDPESDATVFDVWSERGEHCAIDLGEDA